ncbi:hypothetical protein AURDEDRAFT_167573 [Auricularia subglabra TFB-10046 SS5]|nr:hypothetical protein AURDEDRAFT_167573 [Auricularia subglabra TFB-10046 SS5]
MVTNVAARGILLCSPGTRAAFSTSIGGIHPVVGTVKNPCVEDDSELVWEAGDGGAPDPGLRVGSSRLEDGSVGWVLALVIVDDAPPCEAGGIDACNARSASGGGGCANLDGDSVQKTKGGRGDERQGTPPGSTVSDISRLLCRISRPGRTSNMRVRREFEGQAKNYRQWICRDSRAHITAVPSPAQHVVPCGQQNSAEMLHAESLTPGGDAMSQ